MTDPLTTKHDDQLVHRAATEIMGWHLLVVGRDPETSGPARVWLDKSEVRHAWADPYMNAQAFMPFTDTTDAALLLRAMSTPPYSVRLVLSREVIYWELRFDRHFGGMIIDFTVEKGQCPTIPQAARQVTDAFFRSRDPNQDNKWPLSK